MSDNTVHFHRQSAEDWRVTLVDTGENTLTGGRLKRVAPYLEGEDSFCFTYGDGLSDVDISATIEFHKSHGRLATVTAVRPPARFGALKLDGDKVQGFIEKPEGEGGFINGGFFVLSNPVLERIEGDRTSFEGEPLSALADENELRAFFHRGFWQPMDTLRDKTMLEALWTEGSAPWRSW
jgi:glucose-1-phosphate cytidylyltransferase